MNEYPLKRSLFILVMAAIATACGAGEPPPTRPAPSLAASPSATALVATTPPPPGPGVTSGPSAAADCPVVVPRVLPNGDPPGEATSREPGHYSWGTGRNRVGEAVGTFALLDDPAEFDLPEWDGQRARIRGQRAIVVPVGDEGVGQITIMWRDGDCPYTVWLQAPHTIATARRYARDF